MENKPSKFIYDLYDIHKDKTMWIIGTGLSINDFPENFFKDKISMALNGCAFRYPYVEYNITVDPFWQKIMLEKKPEWIEKTIIVHSLGWGHSPFDTMKDLTSKVYWMYWKDGTSNRRDNNTEKLARKALNSIVKKENPIDFFIAGTVAHFAIQACFLMGAKKIVLCGCEHEIFIEGRSHGDIKEYGDKPFSEMERMQIGTILLTNLLKEHGVEVIRYFNDDTPFYKKGYKEIE